MADMNALSLDRLYATLAAAPPGLVRRVLELARDEDLGVYGDVTSRVCIAEGATGTGAIVARSPGVIAGLAALGELVEVFGSRVRVQLLTRDGAAVDGGVEIATLTGPLREVLAIERTALNLIGRLSGIATRTATYVKAAAAGGGRGAVYDTRKTTPGLRVLEKYAVRCGGGRCHRMGLHDALLIKDNHLAGVAVSGIAEFVRDAAGRARRERPDLQFVEVEVDTLEQLEAVLGLERGIVDIVLLDNMSTDDLKRAVAMRDASLARPELEASGGVRLDTIGAIAATGVERISVGGITHSAHALDVALDVVP